MVRCYEKETDLRVSDGLCSPNSKPLTHSECGTDVCSLEDDDDEDGEREQTNEIDHGASSADDDIKQHFSRYRWKVGPWHSCSKECGRGVQTRAVACFDSKRNTRDWPFHCKRSVVKPRESRMCNVHPCAEGRWIEGKWSGCSVSCGKVTLFLI